MNKYLQIALLSSVILIMAVSIGDAAVDRHNLATALVLLNNTSGKIAVLQPAPVWLPGLIIGGSWQGKPFELYLYTTGNTFQKYLAYDDSAKNFLWKPYTDIKKISPLFDAAGLLLPDYYMFEWPVVEDSSIMPQGEVTLNLCVDPKQDNVLDLTTAACGQATINVQGCTPTLKISPSSINATYTQGDSMQSEQITVSDNCNNTYTLKESTGATWLAVTPAGLVTFTPGLTAKTYTANVDILNAQGVKSGTVPVKLTVNPGQKCTSGQGTPNPLVLSAGFDGSASGDIKFTNSCGNADISAASISANTSWLTIKSTTGNTASVTASSTGLTSGIMVQGSVTATIRNTNEKVTVPVKFTPFIMGGSNSGGSVPICLPWDTSCTNNTSTNCLGYAWPNNIDVSKSDRVAITLSDCKNAAITQYTASVNKSWITVTPRSGTSVLDIAINVSGLTPGTTDTGTITITPTNTNIPTFTVPVTARTAAQCTMDTSIKFVWTQSQSDVSQINKSVSVNSSALGQDLVSVMTNCNRPAREYSYTVVEGATASSAVIPNWLTVAHTDGSETMTITYIDAAIRTKPSGTYTAWIKVNNGTYPEVLLQVTLTVTAPPVPASCTSFTYSAWSSCLSNNTQTRTVISQLPAGCSGGAAPVTTQSCTYTPPPPSGYCEQVTKGNSYFRIQNSGNTTIQVYFDTVGYYGFGAIIDPGACNLVAYDLSNSYTLKTTVEITQCTSDGDGGCVGLYGPTKYVPLTLQMGQTKTITVDSNYFN